MSPLSARCGDSLERKTVELHTTREIYLTTTEILKNCRDPYDGRATLDSSALCGWP